MFRRAKKPSLAIDMAPLIDVVFLLLIFFMLTSRFAEPSLPLTLPEVLNVDARESTAVVVSLDAEGRIAIDGQIVSRAAYEDALSNALANSTGGIVHFRGDASVDYGQFLELMDASRRAGAAEFNLIHAPGR